MGPWGIRTVQGAKKLLNWEVKDAKPDRLKCNASKVFYLRPNDYGHITMAVCLCVWSV